MMRILGGPYRKDEAAMIAQPGRSIRSMLLIAVVVSGTLACSSTPEQPQVSARTAVASGTQATARRGGMTVGERAAAVALQQVGVPYRYGGVGPSGFDCSGLVHYSYAHAGKSVPRTTAALWAKLAPVEAWRMQTGDLLFFNIEGKMSHVGLYLGDGRFVHAPSSGRVVSIESLDSDYYRDALIRAGRPR